MKKNNTILKGAILIMCLSTVISSLTGCGLFGKQGGSDDGSSQSITESENGNDNGGNGDSKIGNFLNKLFGKGSGDDHGDGFDDGFDYEGNDFSQDGPGKYHKVTGLYFSIGGYNPGYSYYIYQSEGDPSKTLMEYDDRETNIDTVTCEVDDSTLEKLSKLCEQLNIISWDNFNRNAKYVLDGEGFSLSVNFADADSISASGSNAFPKNFSAFEQGLNDILKPVAARGLEKLREEMYQSGVYSQPLQSAMLDYKQRGASGSDSYEFWIHEPWPDRPSVEVTIKSVSGDFIEPGNYSFRGDIDDPDELLDKMQKVLEKYEVYKWDGYDASTSDYNDREWFQLSFSYPEASISCYGCGDTEHYEEVRKELLALVIEYTKDVLTEE